MGKLNTQKMDQQRTLRERYNRADEVLKHSQITDNEDPRIALSQQINAGMAALSEAERDALLEEWGY